jgi:hypothetical protein
VRYQPTVFQGLLQQLPWDEFERLVDEHGADASERGFSSKRHLVAMLYAQLAGATALRELECGLNSHAAGLYHLGGGGLARSTLADANRDRPSALFSDLFAALLARLPRSQRKQMAEATYLIDASVLPLAGQGSSWARFSAELAGAKLHLVYDAGAERPIYAAVTAARVNDITLAKSLPIQPGATYVFDLGYYDYAWWAELQAAGCTIVTRFKRNTPLSVSETRALPAGSTLLSDRIGTLPARQAKNRRNPMAGPVREIRLRCQTGRELRLFTNDLTAPAEQIATLYRRRWDIELFFRWVKQTLRIRKFLGRSLNAVRIQLATALIAYLLLRFAQARHHAKRSLLDLARLVRSTLMHRRPIIHIDQPPPKPSRHPERQPALL